VVALLIQKDGLIPIERLQQMAGISERQLERQFQTRFQNFLRTKSGGVFSRRSPDGRIFYAKKPESQTLVCQPRAVTS